MHSERPIKPDRHSKWRQEMEIILQKLTALEAANAEIVGARAQLLIQLVELQERGFR